MSVRVLVVSDDSEAANDLEMLMRSEGYNVDRATSQAMALKLCQVAPPDLVFVESQLPDVAGIELCRQIRQKSTLSHLPVVIVSSQADDIDCVVAFELGADDFITKACDPRELRLRVKAILRRCYPGAPPTQELREGPLRLNRDSHRVWLHSMPLDLTETEFRLLELLMLRRGRGQDRERLLQEVWGGRDVSARTVDTHVRRLREKLGDVASYIHTIRGVGYCFGHEDKDLTFEAVSRVGHRIETDL